MSLLPTLTDTSLRAGILLDLVETIIAVPAINGVIDDLPFDYTAPPMPRPGHGKALHPFTYVCETSETASADEYLGPLSCRLAINVETTFEYSTTDGANGLMPRGRALLAAVQQAVLRDPNRGWQTLTNGDRVKRAQRTTEGPSSVGEAIEVGGGLGVVVQQFTVEYVRSAQDPGAR